MIRADERSVCRKRLQGRKPKTFTKRGRYHRITRIVDGVEMFWGEGVGVEVLTRYDKIFLPLESKIPGCRKDVNTCRIHGVHVQVQQVLRVRLLELGKHLQRPANILPWLVAVDVGDKYPVFCQTHEILLAKL